MPQITYISHDQKDSWTFDVSAGKSVMEIARDAGLDVEGACEGIMACSTCHVILEPDHLARLDPASSDERDMLDLTWGVTPRSRLGCQIVMTDALDGLVVSLPGDTRNMLLGGL